VSAGALRVRAIGTAFNVSRRETQTDVLVTEGRVALLAEAGDGSPRRLFGPKTPGEIGDPDGGGEPENGNRAAREAPPIAELGAGERAVVKIAEAGSGEALPEIAIVRVEAADIRRELAWQENLLRLGGATLGEIAAEIERRTGQRVVLADSALAEVRLGGRFRANDAEGFANLLAAMLDVEAERSADGTITLREKK